MASWVQMVPMGYFWFLEMPGVALSKPTCSQKHSNHSGGGGRVGNQGAVGADKALMAFEGARHGSVQPGWQEEVQQA